ncbi:hypothetical protein LJR143_003638 [Pseudoxanthomonas sp. LjRoot143]|uniref:hypothetical protein n=1 Tax=Pseudoxanthomonas sp. LjRoot143 TaxID=3342266 RepID=UPI003ED0B8D5
MSIEIVLKETKSIESMLGKLGANGRGLREKAESIKHLLTDGAFRNIRFMATVRNKLVHEDGFDLTDKLIRDIVRVADFIKRELHFILNEPGSVRMLASAGQLRMAAPQADARPEPTDFVRNDRPADAIKMQTGEQTSPPISANKNPGASFVSFGLSRPWYKRLYFWFILRGWVPGDSKEAREVAETVLLIALALGIEVLAEEYL